MFTERTMPQKKKEKPKRLRVTLDLEQSDVLALSELVKDSCHKSTVLRKAIKILSGLSKEEFFLTNAEGSRIPKSIIFS